MSVKFSKEIAEVEDKDIQHVWQKPSIYRDVRKGSVWIVYGRKGAGKSTIIEYLERDNAETYAVKIRPPEFRIFQQVMAAIDFEQEPQHRLIEEGVISTLEFLLYIFLADRMTCGLEDKFVNPGSFEEKIYKFLTANGFIRGSAIKRAIELICSITEGDKIKIVPNFSSVIEKDLGGIKFEEFKEALYGLLKALDKTVLLCIDDVDEVGFSFSLSDRIYIDSFIALVARSNTEALKRKAPLRLLLTIPSEIYFHSRLYGADWVDSKTKSLTWTTERSLFDICNKRIGLEFNVRKKKPRWEGDKYSSEPDRTWGKLFPAKIYNKNGMPELSFKYVLRHTFYTPRHVLLIMDNLIEEIDTDNPDISSFRSFYSDSEWAHVFRDSVEEFSTRLDKNFRDLYSKVYGGLSSCIEAFQSRPNVWRKRALLEFIEINSLELIDKENDDETVSGESLVFVLQQLGFFGLGVRRSGGIGPNIEFDMRYSFLERHPSRRPWDIGVITPLFYDTHNIQPLDKKIIVPHDRFIVSTDQFQRLGDYDYRNNFLRQGK